MSVADDPRRDGAPGHEQDVWFEVTPAETATPSFGVFSTDGEACVTVGFDPVYTILVYHDKDGSFDFDGNDPFIAAAVVTPVRLDYFRLFFDGVAYVPGEIMNGEVGVRHVASAVGVWSGLDKRPYTDDDHLLEAVAISGQEMVNPTLSANGGAMGPVFDIVNNTDGTVTLLAIDAGATTVVFTARDVTLELAPVVVAFVKTPPPQEECPDVFIEGIQFDWDKSASAQDAIGVRKTVFQVSEDTDLDVNLFDHSDTTDDTKNYGWSPRNEDASVTGGRAWDISTDLVAAQLGGGNNLNNLQRFSDSPVLYHVPAPPGGWVILVAFRLSTQFLATLPQGTDVEYFIGASGNRFADVPFTSITFDRTTGRSKRDKTGEQFVPMRLRPRQAVSSISLVDETLHWLVRCEGFDADEVPVKYVLGDATPNADTNHRIYVSLGDPVLPWVANEDDPTRKASLPRSKPWTEILDIACAVMAGGTRANNALPPLESYLFRLDERGRRAGVGLELDYTGYGNYFPVHDAQSFALQNSFSLRQFHDNLLNRFTIRNGKKQNFGCFDFAAAFALFARTVGIDARMIWCDPFTESGMRRQLLVPGDFVVGGPNAGKRRVYDGPFTNHAYNGVGTFALLKPDGSMPGRDRPINVLQNGTMWDSMSMWNRGTQATPNFIQVGGSVTSEPAYWRFTIDEQSVTPENQREQLIQRALNRFGSSHHGDTILTLRHVINVRR